MCVYIYIYIYENKCYFGTWRGVKSTFRSDPLEKFRDSFSFFFFFSTRLDIGKTIEILREGRGEREKTILGGNFSVSKEDGGRRKRANDIRSPPTLPSSPFISPAQHRRSENFLPLPSSPLPRGRKGKLSLGSNAYRREGEQRKEKPVFRSRRLDPLPPPMFPRMDPILLFPAHQSYAIIN